MSVGVSLSVNLVSEQRARQTTSLHGVEYVREAKGVGWWIGLLQRGGGRSRAVGGRGRLPEDGAARAALTRSRSEEAAGVGKSSSSTGDGLAELEGRPVEVEVEGWVEDEGHLCGIGSVGQLCRPALLNTTAQLKSPRIEASFSWVVRQ